MSDTVADKIAAATYACYSSLPSNGRPNEARSPHEFTVVASFVATIPNASASETKDSMQKEGLGMKDEYVVVSLATGTKCIGSALERETSATGCLLHDSHAEVLARRGLIIYLLRYGAFLPCSIPCLTTFKLHTHHYLR